MHDLKEYDPEKIYLFGSYARGDARDDSDIDLLIVKDTEERPLSRIDDVTSILYPKNKVLTERFDWAIDPVVITSKELSNRNKNFFYKNILKEGKLLYERR